MMERKKLEFVLEARQPVAHHSETFGNTSVLMRQKVRQPDGSWSHVPIITGDTMRHGLREAATYALLECAGLLNESLTEAALRLLFAGGMVTGSHSAIKLDDYREMVELMPPLALLGGCAQNRVIPGRMAVDPALLICDETRHLLPEWVLEWCDKNGVGIDGARAHVEEVQRVRMDPTLDPSKRLLLSAGERQAIEQRLLVSETASSQNDHKKTDDAKSSMMPRRYETVAQGSHFYWAITATCYSELDVDTLMVMVAAFLRDARVGGKQGTGHGLVVPLVARNVQMANWAERAESMDLIGADQSTGALFRAHVTERAERIREFLGAVAA